MFIFKKMTIGVAIAVVAVLLSPVSAVGATYSDEEGHALFVAEAQQNLGYSLKQAEKAWQSPALRNILPVTTKETTTVGEPTIVGPSDLRAMVAKQPADRAQIMAAAGVMQQRTFTTKKSGYTLVGIETYSITTQKTFRYDGVRAYHDSVVVTPWANAPIGWTFDSVNYSVDQYGSIGGIPYSVSISDRHAHFSNPIGASAGVVGTHQEGRYNGVINYSTSGS